MKKILLGMAFLSTINLMAGDALKSEVSAWLSKDQLDAKTKYDGLSQDKQQSLDGFFEYCRNDVASGKLPKGTCKPAFLDKLKAM